MDRFHCVSSNIEKYKQYCVKKIGVFYLVYCYQAIGALTYENVLLFVSRVYVCRFVNWEKLYTCQTS